MLQSAGLTMLIIIYTLSLCDLASNLFVCHIMQFAVQYNGVMLQKKKLNSFQDGSRKKLQINTKDNFWMVCFYSGFIFEGLN